MPGGGGDPGQVLKQGQSLLLVDRVVMGQFEAICIMFCVHRAIQAVPSAWSR